MGVSFFVFGACGGSTKAGDGDGQETGGGTSETGGRAPTGGAGGSGGSTGGAGGSTGGLGGAGGSGGWTTCFAAGTAIRTPRGEVAIERLRVGDVVLGYDEDAHRVVESPVTAVFVHPDGHPGTLTTGDGRVLHVTAEHPVYLPDNERYVPASELAGNERLLSLDAHGSVGSRIGSALVPGESAASATVYNITVAGVHNYFAEGVLVHNKSGGAPPCNPLPVQSPGASLCTPPTECIDPTAPTGEFIAKNQPVRIAAVDAGASMDAGPPPDSGLLASDAMPPLPPSHVNVSYCRAPSPSAPSSYLAFDTLVPGGFASIELFTAVGPCGVASVGEVWLSDHDAPPPYTWTTQCVALGANELRSGVNIYTDTPGALVRNPRFVMGCECPRARKTVTTCGVQDPLGNGGGSACY